MKTRVLKQKGIVFILVIIVMITFGTQNISYAQEGNPTITASVEAPVTEATLSGSVVTLTLSGATFERSTFRIRDGVSVSGIDGVTVGTFDVDRVSDTKVTVELTFSGNIDTDTNLVFTVGAGAIADYDGDALTAQLPVTAVAETLVATTEVPLTETTLSGSVVTLTLSGRAYARSGFDIERAITISGIEGVRIGTFGVERVSNSKVTVELTFSGNIDADGTLTITVGAGAITNYNQAFTIQLPVTAVEESLEATTEAPLTEASLHGSVVTLTLSGRVFDRSRFDIERAITISGIEGVRIGTFGVERVNDTKVTVELTFSGNIDTDATLTIEVDADAIVNYNEAFTFEFPVTAVEESISASTKVDLTEETLHGNIVTLTLDGRSYEQFFFDIQEAVSVSGIEGVTVGTFGIDRVSDTVVTVELSFSGNFDEDGTLTITVGADAIIGYNQGFTVQLPVTAVEETLVASTVAPLTEATLSGSVVTLTLSGRAYARSPFDIQEAVSVSGIEGVTFDDFFDVDRVSDTEVTIELSFLGNIDEDGTLTITVGANAVAGYDQAFSVQLSVTALQESLDASSEFPITEATLDGSVVKLTLSGRSYEQFFFDIQDAVSVSGIEGVSVGRYSVDHASSTEMGVRLNFDGTDFDIDDTLTFTVGAAAIAGYEEALTAQIPVTAVKNSAATVRLLPNPVVSAPIGKQITVSLSVSGGKDVAGYQAVVDYDASTLRYVETTKGNYLPKDAYILSTPPPEDDEFLYPFIGIIETTLSDTGNGDGTLATITFEIIAVKPSTLTLSEVYLVDSDGVRWEVHLEDTAVIEPLHRIFGDVNRDGVVNIQDLIFVSERFGLRGDNSADVNEDGIVDIVDLVLVGGAFGDDAAAPPLNPEILEQLTAADVQGWLNKARQLTLTDPAYLRGITVLEQLHRVLTPKETALLPNFPNPFNPETWIPYHLSKDADVTLHIYAMNGTLVRMLTLGHQAAGMYQSRSRAAYWDGKNAFGESVSSGLYFYTLTAGDFTATRKMLIRK